MPHSTLHSESVYGRLILLQEGVCCLQCGIGQQVDFLQVLLKLTAGPEEDPGATDNRAGDTIWVKAQSHQDNSQLQKGLWWTSSKSWGNNSITT
jgi:hypothetical protein